MCLSYTVFMVKPYTIVIILDGFYKRTHYKKLGLNCYIDSILPKMQKNFILYKTCLNCYKIHITYVLSCSLHSKQNKRLLVRAVLVRAVLVCVVLQVIILGRKGLHHFCDNHLHCFSKRRVTKHNIKLTRLQIIKYVY